MSGKTRPDSPAGRRRSRTSALGSLMVVLAWVVLTAAGCSAGAAGDGGGIVTTTTTEPSSVGSVSSRAVGDEILVAYNGRLWDFMAGVNLGATIPGHYPGELAIDAETYRRWFPMMADLGFRFVRVYTIQNPSFYQELRAYNLSHPEAPLFLVQGVWIDEERFLEVRDLYDEQVTSSFDAEIGDAVGAVTGSVEIPQLPGHAHGTFTADVTDWTAAWIVGIELDPVAVRDSEHANRGEPAYTGRFFESAEDSTSTESWYAARLDRTATELRARGLEVPLAFTNWPTTDPLVHLDEPIIAEDLVSLDPNHVSPTSEWQAGYFASYHAYPYFPDFQKHEPGIFDYAHQGAVDPYAGYLAALRDHHAEIPVVVAEFGVSGGMAMAHRGPLGRNQGALNESEQMAINADLLQVIHDVGLAGGLVFEWADEWFKFSWNTIAYEVPGDRRALWDNAWTNEAQFGVLAVEPGAAQGIVLDGNVDDWDEVEASEIAGRDGVRVRAHHDPGYLYLSIETRAAGGEALVIGFDVVPGASGGLPGTAAVMPAADVALTLGPDEVGEALTRASNDPFGIRFGLNAGYIQVDQADYVAGSGVWALQRLLTSHPLEIPTTGELVPAETFEVGTLHHGKTDPAGPGFDSRSSWYRDSDVVEIRVPYAALGIADPSSLEALVVASDGTISTTPFSRIAIAVLVGGVLHETDGYTWEPWSAVEWHERLRLGTDRLAATVHEVSGS